MDDRFVNLDLEEVAEVADELETAVYALKRIARVAGAEHDAVLELYEAALEALDIKQREEDKAMNRMYEEMI